MTIQVMQAYSYAEPISIKYGYYEDGEFVLDECDHAGAEETTLEFTTYSSYDGGAIQAPDDSEEVYVLYCNACNHYQNYDKQWMEY